MIRIPGFFQIFKESVLSFAKMAVLSYDGRCAPCGERSARMEVHKQMRDNQDSASAGQPRFDDEQWAYLLRQDALMTELVKHTATLELLHTYYREITTALHRRPTPELHTLQANTIARIRAVTASAAQVLA